MNLSSRPSLPQISVRKPPTTVAGSASVRRIKCTSAGGGWLSACMKHSRSPAGLRDTTDESTGRSLTGLGRAAADAQHTS